MAIRNWLQLLGGLGFALVLLVAPDARAAEPFQVAQAQAPAADEDDDIEEIVVLGAESDASDDFAVGDSVTGFGAEDLAALGAASIADLASFTPNLEIVTTGATTPTFFIRGVGLNDFNANSTGAVSIYVNDVAINAPALQLSSLYDMEAVNVLRGPQGTGIARNSSAGAIKLYSKKPTGQFGGYLRLEGGNFNHQDYEGAVEAPIYEDIVAARFAFRLSERDGTMRNRCGNKPPFGARAPAPPRRGPGGLIAQRKTLTDSPWSMCGEPVGPGGGISPIPVGLPSRLNDRDNWAARGTVLLQPTLDMTWLVGFQGSRRDEFSRVGQSYGTGGTHCLGGDATRCDQDFPGGTLINNQFGGRQGISPFYQPPEVRLRLTELAPCYEFGFGESISCGIFRTEPLQIQLDAAKAIVARELAQDLDSSPWEGDFNEAGKTQNDVWGAFVSGEIALPLGMTFTTVTGYDAYRRHLDIDLDFSPETLFHIRTADEGWQYTSSALLEGEVELVEGSPILWDFGAYWLEELLDVAIDNDLGLATALAVGSRTYSQEMLSFGAHGNMSFDFWDDFNLSGGARWNWEEKEIPDYELSELGGGLITPLDAKEIWSAWTGTVKLTYHFREDTAVSWKYSRGWKPGHFNATGSRTLGITTAEPEQIDAFETGLQGAWFDGRLGFQGNLFYYNYSNYQIFTTQQFAGGGPEFVVINANDAEVYGAEVDILLRPWDGAFVNIRPSWLESQFLDFLQVQQATVSRFGSQVTINRELQNSGNPLLNSPKFKVSITAEQTIPLGKYGSLTPRYDGVWTDDTFYDATKGRGIPNEQNVNFLPKLTIAQRAFWLHNLRLAYRPPGGQIEFAAWIRNLENKPYKTFAFDGSTFQGTTIFLVGDPRTFGFSAQINF